MSVQEMKKTLINLVEKQDDTQKLQKALEILANTESKEWSAQEIFDRVSSRYNNTLKKLAQ